VAKVWKVQNVAREDGNFLALWYWPKAPKGLHNGLDTMWTCYMNCLIRRWKLDQMYKGHDWIEVNFVFVS
jgi:hypothetical protein